MRLIGAIIEKNEITISYYRVDRTMYDRRVQPVSLMFSKYYFYLIAYYPGQYDEPRYFCVGRIAGIVEHRKRLSMGEMPDYDEREYRTSALSRRQALTRASCASATNVYIGIYSCVMLYCVDSGFTFFGLVEQDYTLPADVLRKIGTKAFEYEKVIPKQIALKRIELRKTMPKTLGPQKISVIFCAAGL